MARSRAARVLIVWFEQAGLAPTGIHWYSFGSWVWRCDGIPVRAQCATPPQLCPRPKGLSSEATREFTYSRAACAQDTMSNSGRKATFLPALLALYVALLVAKVFYVGAVLVVPYFVHYFIRLFEGALGTPLGNYHVSGVWLGAFGLLTVLTVVLAFRYAGGAAQAPARMESEAARRLALRNLVVSWVLLDSISFYGVVSKVLRYSDIWCYGFILLSALLTVVAGWPLLVMRREVGE